MMILKKVAGYKKGARLSGARISASNRLGGGKKNLQRGKVFGLVSGWADELAGVLTWLVCGRCRRSSVVKAFRTARALKQAIRYYVGRVMPAMICCVRRAIDAACDAGVWLERVTRRAVMARGGDWKAGQGRGGLAVRLHPILLMGSLKADIGAKAVHP